MRKLLGKKLDTIGAVLDCFVGFLCRERDVGLLRCSLDESPRRLLHVFGDLGGQGAVSQLPLGDEVAETIYVTAC